MRRVSSQRTTSASASSLSARNVTSSRFPIGVGQRTSGMTSPYARSGRDGHLADVQRLEGDEAGSDQPGRASELGQHDGHVVPGRWKRSLGDDLPRRLEQELAGLREAPADDDHLRVEDVHVRSNADPEVEADVVEHVLRVAVALAGQLGREPSVDDAPGCRGPAEVAVRPLGRGFRGELVRREPRCERLEMPAPGAGSLTRRPVDVDR